MPLDNQTYISGAWLVEPLAETRTHHQYSLRLARPVKTVYFFQNRFTAAGKGAP